MLFALGLVWAQEDTDTTTDTSAVVDVEEGDVEEPAIEEPVAENPAQIGIIRTRIRARCQELHKRLSDVQKVNVAKLKDDLFVLKSKLQITPEQKEKFKSDILKCLTGVQRPAPATVRKLAQDLVKAFVDGLITPDDIAMITKDIQAILNSANISKEDAKAVADGIREVITASNITKADANIVFQDVQAILKTLKMETKGRRPFRK
jgi:hypothetical protein